MTQPSPITWTTSGQFTSTSSPVVKVRLSTNPERTFDAVLNTAIAETSIAVAALDTMGLELPYPNPIIADLTLLNHMEWEYPISRMRFRIHKPFPPAIALGRDILSIGELKMEGGWFTFRLVRERW